MIGTLDEAWEWYDASRQLSRVAGRLGSKHWDDLPWDGSLGRDEILRQLEAAQIEKMAALVLNDLDDLCVLLLFSVFEMTVRERALSDIARELPELHHPILMQAVMNVNETIENGSFYRVLDAFKSLDSSLVEEVNQVRRYRNWVAHGRRGIQPDNVSPAIAYDRLGRFLQRLGDRE